MLNSKLYLISNNLLLSDEGSERVPDQLPTQNATIYVEKKKTNEKQCERIVCAISFVCPLADGLFFISRTVLADVWPALTSDALHTLHRIRLTLSRFIMCRRTI